MRGLGAMHVVDYRAPDLAEQVRAIAPDGVDAVIDTVSARSATESLALLKHAGHLVAVAGRPDLRSIPEFGLAPTISEVALGRRLHARRLRGPPLAHAGGWSASCAWSSKVTCSPWTSRSSAFDDIPAALARLADAGGRRPARRQPALG